MNGSSAAASFVRSKFGATCELDAGAVAACNRTTRSTRSSVVKELAVISYFQV
jgi:hypothetical protein